MTMKKMMMVMRSAEADQEDQIVQLTMAPGDCDHDRQWEKKQKAPHSYPRPGKVSQNI